MIRIICLFTALAFFCSAGVMAAGKKSLTFDGSAKTTVSVKTGVPAPSPAQSKSLISDLFLRHYTTHEYYEYDNKDDAMKALARFKTGLEKAGARVEEAKLGFHGGSYYLTAAYSGNITFSGYYGASFYDLQSARAAMEKIIPVLEGGGATVVLGKYCQSVKDESGRMTYSYRIILGSDKGIIVGNYSREDLKTEAQAREVMENAVAELKRRGALILEANTYKAQPADYTAVVQYVGQEYK